MTFRHRRKVLSLGRERKGGFGMDVVLRVIHAPLLRKVNAGMTVVSAASFL